MRNKASRFPEHTNHISEDGPRAKAKFASKRADGTINTHPQERMHASGNRDSERS